MLTVFVAATVPVLGLPSLLLRNYTQTIIAVSSRFFEDVATFALDKNGEQLISAHIDRTVLGTMAVHKPLQIASLFSKATLGMAAAFAVYLILCAVCELVGAWRASIVALE